MSELHEAVREGDLQRVKKLLERGANVNAKDDTFASNTPLHYAAMEGYLEVARLLVEKGAYVNARNSYGWTPLHYAAYYGHLEVVRFLLEAGADPTLRNNDGRTPADLARKEGYGDIVELIEDWVKDWVRAVRAGLIASVEVGGLVEGEWGVLRVQLNRPSKLMVEGDVEWMDPGLVKGVVEVPVKAKKAGRMPVAVVAKSSGREERKVVWVEVAEGRKVESAAALCPNCGAPREPGAKYCWRCGARLAG
ncbi:MAG: ankyrin repeat domain-containing protein [Thermofilaceae archaeon]